MTNIVKKGANRPAHNAKVAKHAQRTPLPPRTPIKADPPARTSAQVIADEVAARKVEQHAAGEAKARSFAEHLEQHGWLATTVLRAETGWEVQGNRMTPAGPEVLFANWINGKVTDANLPWHRIGSTTRRLRNVSAARQVAAIAPSEVVAPRANTRDRLRSSNTAPAEDAGREPFFTADVAPSLIIAAIVGRRISWVRRFKDEPESATVVSSDRNIRVRGEGDDRYVEFNTEEGPMYAIFLNAIVEVH